MKPFIHSAETDKNVAFYVIDRNIPNKKIPQCRENVTKSEDTTGHWSHLAVAMSKTPYYYPIW